MGLKTYLPRLLFILRLLCKYIGNHREKIDEFVGEENVDAVTAVLTACEVLTDILIGIIPQPS